MKKLKKLRLNALRNEVLLISDDEMCRLVGGGSEYDGGWLSEIVCYAVALHTGDTSTCPLCSQILSPAYYIFNGGGIDGSVGFELGMQKYCESMKGKR